MRRILIVALFLILCFFLVACNEVNYNAQIKNNTNESVVLAVTINGTDRIITLNPDQSFDITNVADKITSVKVVKDAGHADITDNRYVVLAGRRTAERVFLQYEINKSPAISYSIRNLVLPAVYGAGSGHLYLTEQGNKIGTYSPTNENRIELTQGLVTNISVYTDSPQFVLMDGSGNKNQLNGYKVVCELLSGNMIVII